MQSLAGEANNAVIIASSQAARVKDWSENVSDERASTGGPWSSRDGHGQCIGVDKEREV